MNQRFQDKSFSFRFSFIKQTLAVSCWYYIGFWSRVGSGCVITDTSGNGGRKATRRTYFRTKGLASKFARGHAFRKIISTRRKRSSRNFSSLASKNVFFYEMGAKRKGRQSGMAARRLLNSSTFKFIELKMNHDLSILKLIDEFWAHKGTRGLPLIRSN